MLKALVLFCVPRSTSQVLAFLFALLAVSSAGVVSVAAVSHRESPRAELWWPGLLALASAAARFSPWWRAQASQLTADRVRNAVGAALVVLAAGMVSWHYLSADIGVNSAYPLLGRASGPAAGLTISLLLALAGVALLLRLPVVRWTSASLRSAHQGTRALRRPQTLATAAVDEIPYFEADDEFDQEPYEDDDPLPLEAAPVIDLRQARRPAHRGTVPAIATPLPPLDAPATRLPPIDTFAPAVKGPAAPSDVEHNAQRIEETLASFRVGARVVDHHCGPAVTQFDILPDRGVKVKSITALQNDLALALAAPTIRIQAPVPGKSVVGIEIPNASATTVSLRELLESEAYRKMTSPLAVVLGKDVVGGPAVIDLAKMPHLLIAGATGSGKSVCVNALISCLLYRNTPDDVRLMMVDPKMVELTVYNGVPHLLSPVVTQPEKVIGVLQWALREMERRYQLFSTNTVRNITRFNEKMEAAGVKKLPYIVLIIDELADLMMVAPEDVEEAICRLAQLARAAGIHLVIATQRPSVDVVTGLIKANFPARIAFQMTSQVDSRTILDSSGAEKLLGRGDMLYMPPDAPKSVRLQGAFLSDQEIERLVEFWQRSPLQEAVERIKEEELAAAQRAAETSEDDLIEEALRVVTDFQSASVSLLQRRLKVGYSRAARLMDQLEARGVVGAADGSKQRPVMVTSEATDDVDTL